MTINCVLTDTIINIVPGNIVNVPLGQWRSLGVLRAACCYSRARMDGGCDGSMIGAVLRSQDD